MKVNVDNVLLNKGSGISTLTMEANELDNFILDTINKNPSKVKVKKISDEEYSISAS